MPDGSDATLEAEIEAAAALLERIQENRALLAEVPEPLRRRLLIAAGHVSRPDKDQQRTLVRAFRKKKRIATREADDRLLDRSKIREKRRDDVFLTPDAGESAPEAWDWPEVEEPRLCYVCKARFTRLHFFYDQLCPECAPLNYEKRAQTADLRGRVALLTGGRVKIGYQAGIMLLRAGAQLVVTTRFPRDAASRYAAEPDFATWKDRLSVHGLDLRHTPSVEAFAAQLEAEVDALDFIVHNACQTVRRPSGWYGHLLEAERAPRHQLSADAAGLVDVHERLVARGDALAAHDAPALTQVALLAEDRERSERLFPSGTLDQDLQQVDLRSFNSWRMTLAEVPTVELFEVFLVNAIAPFVLNARLKALLRKRPSRDKHIVNVSAMEGQFHRNKTDKHPHTNMAKAALNMMTRTSAQDYLKDGIHMNAVDTGWVTDEDPVQHAARKRAEHRFHPPLDIVDGAARILDPIFDGINRGEHVWGKFLKDYAPTRW